MKVRDKVPLLIAVGILNLLGVPYLGERAYAGGLAFVLDMVLPL